MRIILGSSAIKQIKKLPLHIQKRYETSLDLLSQDYNHPHLHTKKLKNVGNMYSFRIRRDYRGIFWIGNSSVIYIVGVEHRKDIYRKL
jgi:mRNA-degrading endonuclease RelE of RelBE toxin-antitoxin system